MPRNREDLERAAAEAEEWLDDLDPADVMAEDTTDLRAITAALARIAADERELRAAVGAARSAGRSWGRIALALGVSKQAARQRFGASSPSA